MPRGRRASPCAGNSEAGWRCLGQTLPARGADSCRSASGGVDRRPGQTLEPPVLPWPSPDTWRGSRHHDRGPAWQRVVPADLGLSTVLSLSKEFLCDQKYSDEENLPEKLAAFKGEPGLSALPLLGRAGQAPGCIGFLTPQGQPVPPCFFQNALLLESCEMGSPATGTGTGPSTCLHATPGPSPLPEAPPPHPTTAA